MKEMVYGVDRKPEILATGYCLGLLFYIFNLGTHPTAYVKVPKNSRFYGKSDIDIEVHGGITYADDHIWINNTQKIEGWFIGWDYAHMGDYMGYEEKVPEEYRVGGKKWTTEEIYKDVKDVCYQVYVKKEIQNG